MRHWNSKTSCNNADSEFKSPKMWWVTALVIASCLMLACDPKAEYQNKHRGLRVETTISSDGKVVAALDDIGGENARIRIKWLDKDEPWQQYPAPKYANSIRFGLTGYGLLITHAQPGPQGASQLSRWDVSNPAEPSKILFEGTRVAFPVEAKPGQILVRMCSQPPANKACERGSGLLWVLVQDGRASPIKETSRMLPYAQPNVTQDGFFWLINDQEFDGKQWVTHLRLFAYALPGGKAPQLEVSRFGGNTDDLICDNRISRCADIYLTDERIGRMTYVYGIKVFEGSNVCVVDGVKGYADPITLTPDGKSAVFSIARTGAEPRHVVVLRFKPGQCQPTSIQTLNFEEQ